MSAISILPSQDSISDSGNIAGNLCHTGAQCSEPALVWQACGRHLDRLCTLDIYTFIHASFAGQATPSWLCRSSRRTICQRTLLQDGVTRHFPYDLRPRPSRGGVDFICRHFIFSDVVHKLIFPSQDQIVASGNIVLARKRVIERILSNHRHNPSLILPHSRYFAQQASARYRCGQPQPPNSLQNRSE